MIRVDTDAEGVPAGSLVLGYARVAYEDGAKLIEYRGEIGRYARRFDLLLSTTFTDMGDRPPLTRPGLRTLVDVVRTLNLTGVVVPSTRHLSANPPQLRHVLALLRERGCAVLVAQQPAKFVCYD